MHRSWACKYVWEIKANSVQLSPVILFELWNLKIARSGHHSGLWKTPYTTHPNHKVSLRFNLNIQNSELPKNMKNYCLSLFNKAVTIHVQNPSCVTVSRTILTILVLTLTDLKLLLLCRLVFAMTQPAPEDCHQKVQLLQTKYKDIG